MDSECLGIECGRDSQMSIVGDGEVFPFCGWRCVAEFASAVRDTESGRINVSLNDSGTIALTKTRKRFAAGALCAAPSIRGHRKVLG